MWGGIKNELHFRTRKALSTSVRMFLKTENFFLRISLSSNLVPRCSFLTRCPREVWRHSSRWSPGLTPPRTSRDLATFILGDPGTVSRVGVKGASKVFKYWRKRMPAPDWAQKVLCIIVPNRRKYRWIEKMFGMLSAGAIQFARECSVFDSSQCIVNNRKLKMRRRRESQISNSLTRQNNNFARASHFFVHFFAVNCTTTRENA